MARGHHLRNAGILTAVLLVAVVRPASSEPAAGVCEAQSGAVEAALAAKVVELVNAHRRSRGLRVPRAGPALRRSAVWKARQMAQRGYMAHDDGPARTLAQRLRACGFTGSGWGEVLAAGQRRAASVVHAWLGSPSHRAVLEAPWWRVAGAGVARARDGRLYWVLDFGA